MSIIDGCLDIPVTKFGGAKPLLDPIDIEIGDAALANNAAFYPSRVQPRAGFGTAWSPTQAFNSMKYWAQGQSGTLTQYIAYLHDNTTVTLRNLGASTSTDILTGLSGASLGIFAPWGARLYAAFLNSTGFGNSAGYVWDGNTSHTMDQVFQRPFLTSEVTLAATTTGAGVCTAGTHNIAAIFNTRDGYWTAPGPCSAISTISVTLSPTAFTAGGSGNIQVTLTPATTWPTWIANLQILYTSAQNSYQYYVVPGTISAVTAGSSTPVVVTFNISDVQLRAVGSQGAGTLADAYFELLHMDSSNNPPFKPKFVVAWGNRLVWFGNFGGIDSFFPSDPANSTALTGGPESITPNLHIQQLPGALPITTAFVLRGILYVVSGVGGIFAFFDNGGYPVTFSPPQEVDASFGTSAPLGVTVDDSGSGYALIAAPQGMFLFPGLAIPDIPLSYYAGPDWEQIDWTVPLSLVVKIHQQDRLFLVRATLQSGSSQIFTFNYLNGRTPELIKYSPWTIGASYPMGPIEIVENPSKLLWEIYQAPSSASASFPVLRQKSIKAGDTAGVIYHDLTSTGIDFRYIPAPLPENDPGDMLNHVAFRFRGISLNGGTANIYLTVNSIDATHSVTPNQSPISISTTPDAHIIIPYDFTNEQVFYIITNNATADNAFYISYYQHFYNLMAKTR